MSIDLLNFTPNPEIPHERIAELDSYWESAQKYVLSTLHPDFSGNEAPHVTLARESQANFQRNPNARLLIGIAAPGAAGKGTLGRYMKDELAYAGVVNTTTRQMREGEVHGKDYFFTDLSEFTTAQRLGHYAFVLERLGRGMYGISHEEIIKKLASSNVGCIVEENPANLIEILENARTPDIQTALLYVLPEPPIVTSLLPRLARRQQEETDPSKRIVTREIFESTLGDRQIEEFLSLADLPNHPEIAPIFIINANLEETKKNLSALFGGFDDAVHN